MKKLERHALAVLFTITIVAAESSVRVMTASVVVMIVHATAVVVDETMLVRCYTRWFCFRVRKRAVQSMGLGGFFGSMRNKRARCVTCLSGVGTDEPAFSVAGQNA